MAGLPSEVHQVNAPLWRTLCFLRVNCFPPKLASISRLSLWCELSPRRRCDHPSEPPGELPLRGQPGPVRVGPGILTSSLIGGRATHELHELLAQGFGAFLQAGVPQAGLLPQISCGSDFRRICLRMSVGLKPSRHWGGSLLQGS